MTRFFKWGGGQNNFYLRDFRNAYQFRPDIAPPRQKFQGYVNFIINRALVDTLEDTSNFRTRISSLVKTATLPSVNFNTEVKNVFNRKRIINTGVDFEPITITVHDTIQNEWITLFMKYFSYLYMEPRNKFNDGDRDSVTEFNTFLEYLGGEGNKFGKGSTHFDSNSHGYNLPITSNFFERIDMILYHGNKGIQYSLMKPMLTVFKPSEIDYSDSNFLDFQLTFDYENFTTYNVLNFDLSDTDKARFEDVSDVDLPGTYATPRLPVALNETDLDVLGETTAPRRRTAQVQQDNGVGPGNLGQNTDAIAPSYVSENGQGTDGSFIRDVSDFLEDTPFGRIIDTSVAGAIHGTDIFDAASGQIIDEVAAAINNPQAGDIFNGRGIRAEDVDDASIPINGTSGQGGSRPSAGFQGEQ